MRGRLRFTADYIDHRTLAMRLVTSPYAHARVRSIDTEAACALPGVVRVLTAADLPSVTPTTRIRLLLARERVLFVGHPVALVVADSEAAAEDGVDAVLVDYEPLPAVTTIDAAARPDAPLVWPEGVPGEDREAADHGADVGGAADETRGPVQRRQPGRLPARRRRRRPAFRVPERRSHLRDRPRPPELPGAARHHCQTGRRRAR